MNIITLLYLPPLLRREMTLLDFKGVMTANKEKRDDKYTFPYARASGCAKKLDISSSWLLTTSPDYKMYCYEKKFIASETPFKIQCDD